MCFSEKKIVPSLSSNKPTIKIINWISLSVGKCKKIFLQDQQRIKKNLTVYEWCIFYIFIDAFFIFSLKTSNFSACKLFWWLLKKQWFPILFLYLSQNKWTHNKGCITYINARGKSAEEKLACIGERNLERNHHSAVGTHPPLVRTY